jgi:hypothetical protein
MTKKEFKQLYFYVVPFDDAGIISYLIWSYGIPNYGPELRPPVFIKPHFLKP